LFRFATNEDLPALYSLWSEAFGDPPNYIHTFYATHFSPSFTAVCELNGQVCAMANLLPSFLCVNGSHLPARYIYAVATLKSFRGKGIGSALMQFVANYLNQSSLYGYLSPAEKRLYDFYRPLGFVEAFALQKQTLSPSFRSPCSLLSITNEQILSLREQFFSSSGYAAWSLSSFSLIRDDIEGETGQFFKICSQNGQGYMLCYKLKEKWLIAEFAASHDLLMDAVSCLGSAEVYSPCCGFDENTVFTGMTLGQVFSPDKPAWLGYDLQ